MDAMRDLAHYFGRTAFQKEVADQYEIIINGWSQGLFENVIQYVRESEHIIDFPKPFEMDSSFYHPNSFNVLLSAHV